MDNIIDNMETIANNRGSHYIKNTNTHIHVYNDSIRITDLTNALKVGKTCKQVSVCSKNYNSVIVCDFLNTISDLGITESEFIKNLLDKKYTSDDLELLKINYYDKKGIKVFSPFVEIKKIKIPNKWTISHCWKAILSKQITSITQNMYLTDDYKSDAENNFNKDKNRDLFNIAKELIEDKGGWWISVKNETKDTIELGINCHHFDYNTAIFNKNI